MTLLQWQKIRNRLNHDWLRNRILVALGKAINVIDGEVVDDQYLNRLISDLEKEWPAAMQDARLLLDNFLTTHTYKSFFDQPPLSNFDKDTLAWLPVAIDLVWKERTNTELLLNKTEYILSSAEDSFAKFSQEIKNYIMSNNVDKFAAAKTTNCLILNCQKLAEALSAFPHRLVF